MPIDLPAVEKEVYTAGMTDSLHRVPCQDQRAARVDPAILSILADYEYIGEMMEQVLMSGGGILV
jgi:hypothetical protein